MFKEDNAPEEDASRKMVLKEPKEYNALEENTLGKTVREELKILDDDHSKSDNRV